MPNRHLFVVLSVLVGLLALAPRASAYRKQESLPAASQTLFRDVAGELRCPTCTGLSVLDSDAEFSTQIKDKVVEQLAAGKSREEVLQFFTERYGAWILREPPKQGFSATAWLAPLVLMLAGPVVIWLMVWRRRRELPASGLRSIEVIVREMEISLESLRASRGIRAALPGALPGSPAATQAGQAGQAGQGGHQV